MIFKFNVAISIIFFIIFVGVGCIIYINIQPVILEKKLRVDDVSLPPSEYFENIFWFIQISDIHISSHHDPTRASDLKDFIQTDLRVIKPSLVLVTGDLVDSKSKDDLSTQTDILEWKVYKSILEQSQMNFPVPWLDLRGNHDCFDVTEINHESNRFKKYSAMGRKSIHHSYKYVHQTDYGIYSFIGIDACPEPGFKRPFNFFGTLTNRNIVELRHLSKETADHNFTIWFAHYPTATLSVEYNTAIWPTLNSTNTLAYLCGHLHHLGGISYHIYSRQPEGHLELELADWKVNRRYRIMAIDHDLFSFVDCNFRKWPVILVTNPKEARLNIPSVEPLNRMKFSTHIRILVFTPFEIDAVEVSINNVILGLASHINGPLFVLKWYPIYYSHGIHLLNVKVQNGLQIATLTSYFSLDGQLPLYSIIGNAILFSHPSSILYYLFYFVWVIFILTNLLVLYLPDKFFSSFSVLKWARIMKNYNRISLIWLCVNIYMSIGPWCLGEVNSYYSNGIIYLSGVQLPSRYIYHNYMYGIALEQLLTFNIPSTILLTFEAWGKLIPIKLRKVTVFFFYGIIINHMKRCYYFMRWFGWTGIIFNPSTTWILLLYICFYSYIRIQSKF